MNLTTQSEDAILAIIESNANLGFNIVITYNDGGWVSIWTLLTETGHILYKSGVGTPDLGMLDASLREPVSALDQLVSAINDVFSNNLET